MGQFRRQAIGTIAGLVVALAAADAAESALVVELSGKLGAFRVINRGPQIRLDSEVRMQRQVNGTWQDA